RSILPSRKGLLERLKVMTTLSTAVTWAKTSKPCTVRFVKLTMTPIETGSGLSSVPVPVTVPLHASVSVPVGSAACAVDVDRAASASSIGAFISCPPIPLSKHSHKICEGVRPHADWPSLGSPLPPKGISHCGRLNSPSRRYCDSDAQQ